MLSDEQVAAVRASLEGVTPGPWTWRPTSGNRDDGPFMGTQRLCGTPSNLRVCVIDTATRPDAAFLAASRTAVPLMLVELDRLYAALRAAAGDIHSDDAVRDFAVGLLEGEL